MKHKYARFICLLTVFLLLVGCTQSTSSQTSSQPPVSSAPVAPEQPPDNEAAWRQTYYDTAVQNLAPDGLTPLRANLYYPDEGDPLFAMLYCDPTQEYESAIAAFTFWKIQDGEAVEIFKSSNYTRQYPDKPLYLSPFINKETGNPVVCEGESFTFGEGIWSEIANGNQTAVYETKKPGDNNFLVHVFADNKTWNLQEMQLEQPVLQMPISGADNSVTLYSLFHTVNGEVLQQKLSDFLLDTYQPPVPEGAPEWVSRFMKYIHLNSFSAYIPGSRFNADTEQEYGSWFEEIHLPEPVQNNSFQFFSASGLQEADPFDEVYVFTGNGVELLTAGAEIGYRISADTQANIFITESGAGYHNWYLATPEGRSWLFSEGKDLYSDAPYFTFCDGEYVWFDDYEPIDNWLEAHRKASFEKRGYKAEIEQIKTRTYSLPASATWNEMETALIEQMCRHAKDTGQWGTDKQ